MPVSIRQDSDFLPTSMKRSGAIELADSTLKAGPNQSTNQNALTYDFRRPIGG